MPKGKKRKAEEPATASTATYNPLRDRTLLEGATRKLAARLIEHKRPMSAMAFCIEVLQSLGLAEVAIGQAERITISGLRKMALGAHDSTLIVKPDAASSVIVPHLHEIMGSTGAGPATAKEATASYFRKRLEEELDYDQLRHRSLVHIRAFVHPGDAKQILRDLSQGATSSQHATALRESSGTGRNAAYGHVNLSKSPHLKSLLEALTMALKERLGCQALGSKVVCTRYGARGVNYAHMDQSCGGYQAYLLLSQPKLDFNGGELYIVDPAGLHAGAKDHTRCEPWRDIGDLVVFAANAKEASCAPAKAWLHGFREVTAGKRGEEKCHLCVVGLME